MQLTVLWLVVYSHNSIGKYWSSYVPTQLFKKKNTLPAIFDRKEVQFPIISGGGNQINSLGYRTLPRKVWPDKLPLLVCNDSSFT